MQPTTVHFSPTLSKLITHYTIAVHTIHSMAAFQNQAKKTSIQHMFPECIEISSKKLKIHTVHISIVAWKAFMCSNCVSNWKLLQHMNAIHTPSKRKFTPHCKCPVFPNWQIVKVVEELYDNGYNFIISAFAALKSRCVFNYMIASLALSLYKHSHS